MRADEGQAKRLTRLDVLRGIAASAVILFHYHTLFAAPGSAVIVTQGLPWQSFLWPIYTYGNLAVPFFWLLSGIVFQHSYGTAPITLRSFFVRRFARLYPLHFATLMIMAALNLLSLVVFRHPVGEGNNLPNFVEQLLMASHWVGAGHRSFNYPIWSVSMEVLAYAAFFLFLRFTGRGFPRLIVVAALASATALGFANYQATCVALFFLGCIVIRVAPLVEMRLALLGAVAAAAVIGAIALSPFARHTLLAAEYGLFPALLLVVAKVDLTRPPIGMTWLGDLSYGIYLTHVPLLTIVGMAFEGGVPNPARQPWFLVAFIGLVLVVAALSYRWLERPAQRLILRWQFHRDQPRPEPNW